MADKYIENYLRCASAICTVIDRKALAKAINILSNLKKNGGRLFLLGVGGGAGNASHAVNDFRKICGIEAYAPTDNVSELTARINDDGWESIFAQWLSTSRLNKRDCVFVFSVGGGSIEKGISTNLVYALRYAQRQGAKIIGIVGSAAGYTAKAADACVIIDPIDKKLLTVMTESFQSVVWHLLVSHPEIKSQEMKWESIRKS